MLHFFIGSAKIIHYFCTDFAFYAIIFTKKAIRKIMNEEQRNYIHIINQSPQEEILIKKTGWEEIKLTRHVHSKAQIIYTLSGTLHVQIGEENFFVPEKHLAWIPGNVDHDLSTRNRQASLVIFYLSFQDQDIRDFAVYSCNSIIAENIRFLASKGTLINRNTEPDLYFFALYFFKILPTMSPNMGIRLRTLTLPNDMRLSPVLDYMREHAHEDLRIEQVAQAFGFSVRNLSRLLNKSGIRFSNYLNMQRVTRAIEMFADGNHTIQETAFATGFTTPGNFNRVFKQVMGVTPSEFIKARKED